MKHKDISGVELVDDGGDTADLRRSLWLTNMNAGTRGATLDSIGKLCAASAADGELTVARLRQILESSDAAIRARLGERWTQVASDLRRALRHWDDSSTRWLARRLRCRVPTLSDASTAAYLRLSPDEFKRANAALVALAAFQGGTLDDLPATAAAMEPVLRNATPETFGVASMKSLENKRTLVRRVVRLVDPVSNGLRETTTATLPLRWKETMKTIEAQLKDHETSPAAILSRLAGFCARQAIAPEMVNEELVDSFVAIETATHAPGYIEKLRIAFRRWNDTVEAGHQVPRLPLPGAPTHRQAVVDWKSVPTAIRCPVDNYLETAVSVRSPGDWGDFVPDDDPEYADLGIAFINPVLEVGPGVAILEPGTRRNWRDAVKRAWHAALMDPRVQPKPEVLADLFSKPVILAMVASARDARRRRQEAQGSTFDHKAKGRYEYTLVEALCSVGRALAVDPDRLEEVDELKKQLDPNVVGMKRTADGCFQMVYAERRIGIRHATMLTAFNDISRLKRWFEAPSVLWHLACAPIRLGSKPQLLHVALARSALVARIGQYVAPMRRTNYARLRHLGDDRHIMLPVGDGEGTLRIPAVEGKTLREIHVRIDRETVRVLKYYIRHFLPVAQKHAKAGADNPHLFPGAGGRTVEDGGYAAGRGYITKTKLNNAFRNHMSKHCGLEMCLHVMRHLAGKIILDQDPSAMSLVQEILGHKRLKTTQAYYAEVSKIVAQRRYIHLLERQARQVLGAMTFRFLDPQTGKEI